jgi:hypothetical protein
MLASVLRSSCFQPYCPIPERRGEQCFFSGTVEYVRSEQVYEKSCFLCASFRDAPLKLGDVELTFPCHLFVTRLGGLLDHDENCVRQITRLTGLG